MSEVPLYPPRPERAATVPCGHVASRPPSDMPSTPAALASPLAAAADSGCRVSGSINHHPISSACDP